MARTPPGAVQKMDNHLFGCRGMGEKREPQNSGGEVRGPALAVPSDGDREVQGARCWHGQCWLAPALEYGHGHTWTGWAGGEGQI